MIQYINRKDSADSIMTGGGAWRRPRMKVYDYNQDFGGNYYQPMIQYINRKDTYGPFHTREDVYLPEKAEVCSDKYTNMRHADKSCASYNLNDFLVNAYSKQIKELNGSTAMVHYNQLHNSKETTPYSNRFLLGGHIATDMTRRHYARELAAMQAKERRQDHMPGPGSTTEVDLIRERNRMDRIRR